MNIRLTSICDIGKERANNEDAVAVCPDLKNRVWGETGISGYVPLGESGALLIVADGMGGANAGEVASSLAMESVRKSFERPLPQPVSENEAEELLRDAVLKANEAIMAYVATDFNAVGLGTTIVILWLVGESAYIAWCGDSRCYLFNPGCGLRLLTKDHSYVQDLVDKGVISEKEALSHPDGNVVTRCLGDVEALTEPEFRSCSVRPGDIFLLCSDGLSGYCGDKEIGKVMLRNYEDLDRCRDRLLGLALDAGGYDNISIALCATLPDGLRMPTVSAGTKIRRLFGK